MGNPLVVGVVNCASKNLRDLIVLQDTVQFGTCVRLLCRMLKNSIVKDPHRHSVCRRYLRSTGLCAFSSAAASILNPNLVWSQKFDPIDAKRFLSGLLA
jgi:hypothetical protein